MKLIPVFKPSCTQAEINAVTRVLKSGWWGKGPECEKFEKEFADYVEAKYAVSLNSCTAALHLAVKSLGLKDCEIIVPSITFISTALAASYNDCTPIFADINSNTLNIDPKDIKRKITKKTKAIIVVHYGGNPANLDEIKKIAEEYNLKLIEDCAHAAGARYKGKHVGTFGDIGCFSFHPVKNISMGDGGMLVTNDFEICQKVKLLSWCGINKSTYSRTGKRYDWYYEVQDVGYKYHLNDIFASVGRVQLKRLNQMNKRREIIVQQYNNQLKGIEWIDLPPIPPKESKSANHLYVIKTKTKSLRNDLMEYLKSKGINTGVHYLPLYRHPIYKSNKSPDCPITEMIADKLITLPLFPDMIQSDIDKVIKAIKEFNKYEVQNREQTN